MSCIVHTLGNTGMCSCVGHWTFSARRGKVGSSIPRSEKSGTPQAFREIPKGWEGRWPHHRDTSTGPRHSPGETSSPGDSDLTSLMSSVTSESIFNHLPQPKVSASLSGFLVYHLPWKSVGEARLAFQNSPSWTITFMKVQQTCSAR